MALSRSRVVVTLAACVLLSGCAQADETDVSSDAAPATEVPTDLSTIPDPPDLRDASIDCSGVDEPCDHGDDPELDRMWDACADGDGRACDRLYYDSGFDTRYEQFGNTCGDRDVNVPCPVDLPS